MQQRTLVQVLLLLAGIGMVAVSHAADDNYLKALKAETQALSGAPPTAAPAAKEAKPQQTWSAEQQGEDGGEELPPNLSQADFESSLKTNFFGTYVFYAKLGDKDKTVVYQAYQNNRQISNIRDTTTNLLKK